MRAYLAHSTRDYNDSFENIAIEKVKKHYHDNFFDENNNIRDVFKLYHMNNNKWFRYYKLEDINPSLEIVNPRYVKDYWNHRITPRDDYNRNEPEKIKRLDDGRYMLYHLMVLIYDSDIIYTFPYSKTKRYTSGVKEELKYAKDFSNNSYDVHWGHEYGPKHIFIVEMSID